MLSPVLLLAASLSVAGPAAAVEGDQPLDVTASTELSFSFEEDHVSVSWPDVGLANVVISFTSGDSQEGPSFEGEMFFEPVVECASGTCTWNGAVSDVSPRDTVQVEGYTDDLRHVGQADLLPEDTEGPVVTVKPSGTRFWLNQEVHFSVTYHDNQTEFLDEISLESLDQAEVSVDEGASWTHFSEYASRSKPFSGVFQFRFYDEVGNSTVTSSPTIDWVRDAETPRITLSVPSKAHRVSAWSRIKGTARDNRGVRNAMVGLVERRGHRWWAYDWAHRAWYRCGTTESSALRSRHYWMTSATLGTRGVPSSTSWQTAGVRRLTRGTLVVRRQARDATGLRSRVTRYAVSLTGS